MSITGKRMKQRRKQLGISADELAEHLKVSRSTIFRYENGDIEKVPAKLLSDIANFLQTSESFLMGWEDEPQNETSNYTPRILKYYEMLNEAGKSEATKRVEELANLPQYTKEAVPDYLSVKAAHTDSDITDEELRRMREDIENLKNPD